eukprot:gene22825-biopygen1213
MTILSLLVAQGNCNPIFITLCTFPAVAVAWVPLCRGPANPRPVHPCSVGCTKAAVGRRSALVGDPWEKRHCPRPVRVRCCFPLLDLQHRYLEGPWTDIQGILCGYTTARHPRNPTLGTRGRNMWGFVHSYSAQSPLVVTHIPFQNA